MQHRHQTLVDIDVFQLNLGVCIRRSTAAVSSISYALFSCIIIPRHSTLSLKEYFVLLPLASNFLATFTNTATQASVHIFFSKLEVGSFPAILLITHYFWPKLDIWWLHFGQRSSLRRQQYQNTGRSVKALCELLIGHRIELQNKYLTQLEEEYNKVKDFKILIWQDILC